MMIMIVIGQAFISLTKLGKNQSATQRNRATKMSMTVTLRLHLHGSNIITTQNYLMKMYAAV